MFVLRPTPGFADPPICTLQDLRTWCTIDDLMDFHEILDMREELSRRAAVAQAKGK